MKKSTRLLGMILSAVIFITALVPSAFAKEFAPPINTTNLGIQTQYVYPQNDNSWVRKVTIKEDMLSSEGIATKIPLYPVSKYPYIIDAKGFKKQVEENVTAFTLDEDQQKAAYLYILKQLGALTIITEPTTTDQSKADWLRQKGIVITKEDEENPEKVLMISALYALMKNDFYYVLRGERLEIPKGTPLEEALVTYLIALSGQEGTLIKFLKRFMDKVEIGSLEDYIFYSSLFALYTNGYISAAEVPVILKDGEKGKKEVYRRMAIMTIRTYGIAIDGDRASNEEIQQKYLTAMLGMQYNVTLSPDAITRSLRRSTIPFYILQRMAFEDANLTINETRYTYDECFNLVLKKTSRFNLKNEFYADIHEYNVYLKHHRESIAINATPLMNTSLLTLNGERFSGSGYNIIPLENVENQTLVLISRYKDKTHNQSSIYKFNIHQGTVPAPDSDLTGIVTNPNNNVTNPPATTPNSAATLPPILPEVTKINGVASELLNNVLHLNDKGQLVDENGNIISQTKYEKLPEGYKYVMGDDGIIQVVFDESSTEVDNESNEENTKNKNTLIIIISVLSFLLIAAVIATILILKKRSGTTESERMRNRKEKEKKKRRKQQEKEENKKKKGNK